MLVTYNLRKSEAETIINCVYAMNVINNVAQSGQNVSKILILSYLQITNLSKIKKKMLQMTFLKYNIENEYFDSFWFIALSI